MSPTSTCWLSAPSAVLANVDRGIDHIHGGRIRIRDVVPYRSAPVTVATFVKSAAAVTVQVYVSLAPAARSASVLSQSGTRGSLITTFVRVTSPVFSTSIVKVTVSPPVPSGCPAPSIFLRMSIGGFCGIGTVQYPHTPVQVWSCIRHHPSQLPYSQTRPHPHPTG